LSFVAKRCPVCDTEHADFEQNCPICEAELVDDPPAEGEDNPLADSRLVSVFRSDDPGILPLATMALEAEGISHFVKSEGKTDTLDWTRSQPPTNRPLVQQVLVRSDMADRARDVLADLAQSGPTAASAPILDTLADPPAVVLEDVATGQAIGTISESELQELTSELEESAPHEYRITPETLDALRAAGADPALVALLRQAEARTGDLVIRWVVR
jgi:hypothetical protein